MRDDPKLAGKLIRFPFVYRASNSEKQAPQTFHPTSHTVHDYSTQYFTTHAHLMCAHIHAPSYLFSKPHAHLMCAHIHAPSYHFSKPHAHLMCAHIHTPSYLFSKPHAHLE
ncbi:hypothetical protein CDAR_82001 [Caerostris darwini]|uniref:Uncharacterized protein n=1 Tax=Caerostris darwini TaxID=1538125 RepID=A0AAV4V626_9ARAC|nr:hypothetical protein CDAR_82001 [Caerostris darwini]